VKGYATVHNSPPLNLLPSCDADHSCYLMNFEQYIRRMVTAITDKAKVLFVTSLDLT